jgi:hypothetical protein
LRSDLKGVLRKGDIDKIIDEAKRLGYHLRKEEPLLVLKAILGEGMGGLHRPEGTCDLKRQEEQIEALILLLDQVERWGLEIPKEEAQDLMDEMLKEYVLGLEESWWGEGRKKPFSLKIISLAEKLGFSVERFSKMVGPADSMAH